MAATYTVKQVAQILGYSTNSIYTFLKEKRITGVRVGRGRFRIPQSELDRLLLTVKGSSVVPYASPAGVVESPREGMLSPLYQIAPTNPRVDVPSLFDWFVGIGSIVLGLAMYLFSRAHEEYAIEPFLAWMPAIRTTLIAGGFGLLLTDIVGKKFTGWHRIFHGALVVSYVAYAFILGHIVNLEGVIIFGVLAAVLLMTFFVAFGGIAGFAFYAVALLALLPGAAILSPTDSSIVDILSLLPIHTSALVGIWFVVVCLLAGMVWAGYQRDRRVFWLGMMTVSALLILLATNYAGHLLWGRALFILIAGLLSLFVPVWQSLEFKYKHDRSFVFTSFGSLLVLFIIVVGVLRVMQTNILDYASRELDNKVSYGKQLVESTLTNTRTTLASAAVNPLLVTAIEKKDTKTLTDLAKALFEGNSSIRRVAVANAAGESLTYYPLGTVDINGSYAVRDYFIQAMATKKPVTSDLYETPSESARKKVIVIAVPVMGKSSVIGMVVGTIDLDIVGNKLQQIASGLTAEYFVVVDRAGKRVIHPDYSQIGTQVDGSDPTREGLAGKHGVTEGYSVDGIRTLVAYDAINDSTNWAIAIKAPITEVLKATNAANITMISLVIISMMLVGMFLLSHRARNAVPETIVGTIEPKKIPGRRRVKKDTS